MSSPSTIDPKALRCRLQPTGFGQKNQWKKQPEDKVTGVIRFLSKQEAGMWLILHFIRSITLLLTFSPPNRELLDTYGPNKSW